MRSLLTGSTVDTRAASRKAVVSGSATTSFTSADVSKYSATDQ
ncbi:MULTISPECIES: hypothetical protein [Microcella]|nr:MULTISPECIES: hypothetical protein [Microcella]